MPGILGRSECAVCGEKASRTLVLAEVGRDGKGITILTDVSMCDKHGGSVVENFDALLPALAGQL